MHYLNTEKPYGPSSDEQVRMLQPDDESHHDLIVVLCICRHTVLVVHFSFQLYPWSPFCHGICTGLFKQHRA